MSNVIIPGRTAQGPWSKLPDPQKYMRMLRLHKGNWDDQICCSLSVHRMEDDSVYYNAVSYVCGDLATGETVLVDDQPVLIYKNLADALRQLRENSKDSWYTYLWTDILSINQSDLEEKAAQVNSMGKIYRHAKNVFAWLGTDQTLGLAMETFERLAKKNSSDTILAGTQREGSVIADVLQNAVFVAKRRLNFRALAHELGYKQNLYDLIPTNEEETRAMQAFFNCSWFGRTWVWQEVCLSKTAVFMSGKYTCDCAIVSVAMTWLHRINAMYMCFPDANLHETVRAFMILYLMTHEHERQIYKTHPQYLRSRFHVLKKPTLTMLLSLLCNTDCLDARDKIFAVRAVVQYEDMAVTNSVDYKLSSQDVFARFVQSWIKTRKDLDILNFAAWSPFGPTWVIDIGTTSFVTPLIREIQLGYAVPADESVSFGIWSYNASSDLKCENIVIDGSTLKLQGFELGTVNATSMDLEEVYRRLFLQESFIADKSIFQAWQRLIPEDYSCNEHKDRRICFWSTLTAGKNDRGTVQENFERQRLEKWIKKFISRPKLQWSIEDFWTGMIEEGRNPYFFTTPTQIGICWQPPQKGDKIVIMYGGQTPYLIRGHSSHDGYRLISECYVHGVMQGEAMTDLKNGKYSEEEFKLC